MICWRSPIFWTRKFSCKPFRKIDRRIYILTAGIRWIGERRMKYVVWEYLKRNIIGEFETAEKDEAEYSIAVSASIGLW